jgi:hypothetical protein
VQTSKNSLTGCRVRFDQAGSGVSPGAYRAERHRHNLAQLTRAESDWPSLASTDLTQGLRFANVTLKRRQHRESRPSRIVRNGRTPVEVSPMAVRTSSTSVQQTAGQLQPTLNQSPTKPREQSENTRPHFDLIDATELARRWHLPTSWIREQTRSRCSDPIPHLRLGRYVRFEWGSPELASWLSRHRFHKR